MNIRKSTFVLGLAAAVVFGCAVGAWAQSQAKVIWHWPDSIEAVHAAPQIHKVLFENDHIRLLEVTVPVGTTEPPHGHKYPSVFAYDAVQPKLSDHVMEDDTHRTIDRRYEDADWYTPQCRTMGPQAPHQVTILDPFPQHFYRLEFKKMDGKAIEFHEGVSVAPLA